MRRLIWWAVAMAILWFSVGAHAFAPPAPAVNWESAHKAEAKALREELAALRKSVASAKSSTTTAKSTLTKDVESLSTKLTRLQVDNAKLEQDLPQRERSRSNEAQARHLDDLMRQLRAQAGDDVPGDEADPKAQVPALLETIFADVEAQSRLWLEADGVYFDAEGKQVSAPILHVGRVAALRWDDAAVPLIGTAEGFREVVGLPPLRTTHGDVTVARVVVHDPDEPPATDAYIDTGWRGTMNEGGPVMWVLLLIAIVASVVIAERSLGLLWARQRWGRERRRFETAFRERKVSDLLSVKGWIAQPLVIAAGSRCPSCMAPLDANLEERSAQALMVMRERLQRRLSVIGVTAGVAPLLGLLGTVTGMIHTFSVVNATGASDPQQLAAGISQALLTTQFGLAIAIPAFLAHALLSRGARRILASAEQTVLRYLHGTDPILGAEAALQHHDHDHAHPHPHAQHHHHHHHHHHDHDHDHDHDHGLRPRASGSDEEDEGVRGDS